MIARQNGRMLALALACTLWTGSAAAGALDSFSARQKPSPASGRGDRDRRGPDHRVKWWEDAKWRAELGLTNQQAAQIKEIFETTMVQMRADRTELDKLEAALEQTIKAERTDIVAVTQQVDRVENLRAQMQKARVLMIYRMHRVLSAEQRTKLEALYERLQAERRQSDPKRH